ncbi:CDGSH iron-sulfur domain-containing protein [Candidatus Pelagibacter sp.]|nr:CDGSH iron-sulfur domain-containing protein [Candidatus Pelagibacter sp.]
MVYKAELTKKMFFCACKQTNNQPFCDGSHNKK